MSGPNRRADRGALLALPLDGRGIAYGIERSLPFVLSLSKDLISFCCKKGMGFDKLSPNGWETAEKFICDSPAINGRVIAYSLNPAHSSSTVAP
jgi:hypothetical protein